MIICSASTFSANAVMAEENDTVIEATVNLGNENELQPMSANGCGEAPQVAYSMYDYIMAGNDPSIYRYHAYANVSSPYLPGGTSYTTYYVTMTGARLVIGANGSAFYTPDHYRSWIRIH